MSEETDKELEQLRKLDKLRKLVQTILGAHVTLLLLVFLMVLASVLTIMGMIISYSPTRYLASVMLCYQPKQKGKISQYDEKYVLGIWGHEDDDHTIVRFCTSWATKKENVDKLIYDINSL